MKRFQYQRTEPFGFHAPEQNRRAICIMAWLMSGMNASDAEPYKLVFLRKEAAGKCGIACHFERSEAKREILKYSVSAKAESFKISR